MIVCFGDSITYGQGLDDPSREAFPALLGAANRGYCGDTTRIALERFPRDVQESGARKVVIQFGHNDCNKWLSDHGAPRVSIPAFVANLREMMDRAGRFGIEVVLLAPTPTKKGVEYEQFREKYADQIRLISSGIAPPFTPPLVHGFTHVEGMLLDDIHPNRRGHAAIAEALRRHLL